MIMKKLSLILALCVPFFSACEIDSAETSDLNDHNLDYLTQKYLESRLEFPVVMAETALAIDIYEQMTAEEKTGMGYIYRSLLKESSGYYKMNDFYGFMLNTNGKSIAEPGAVWNFETNRGSFDLDYYHMYGNYRYALSAAGTDDGYDYKLTCDSGYFEPYEIKMTVLDDDDAFYAWHIEMSCAFLTEEGRSVAIGTDGPVVRKVYRKSDEVGETQVMMTGKAKMRIGLDPGGNDMMDLDYEYDEIRRKNLRYDF